jgi:hypothetical protein
MSRERAHELEPGTVPEASARGGTFEQADALLCARQFMLPGERPARDEAILSTLQDSVQEITQAATALHGEDVTWHVDAFYPEPMVAAKISVAARTELAEHRRRVSDRVPVLAVGDVAVLRRLRPQEAYPLACARYFAEHVLAEKDLFLGLMIVDTRETQLHAGLCQAGVWRWLR